MCRSEPNTIVATLKTKCGSGLAPDGGVSVSTCIDWSTAIGGKPPPTLAGLFSRRWLFPQVNPAFQRKPIDLRQFFGGEAQVLQRPDVFNNLLRAARADQRAGHPWVTQGPGQGQLGQALATTLGDFIERTHVSDVGVGQVLGLQRTATGAIHPRIGR